MADASSRRRDPALTARLLDTVAERVGQGFQVRRRLGQDGRIHIDRQLPFLVVYRPPPTGPDPALKSFATGGASYLLAPSSPDSHGFVERLVERIAELQSEVFGSFLIIELWGREASTTDETGRPRFEVVASRPVARSPSVEELANRLRRITILGHRAAVELRAGGRSAPPGYDRLVSSAAARRTGTHLVGIAIAPAWLDPDTGEDFPLVRRSLTRQVSRSIQQAAFVFATKETTSRPLHYHALGRRAVVRAVRQVDAELAAVAESYDLLLTVTPTNAERAWRRFKRSGGEVPPRFDYRPHGIDPALLKRQLFDSHIERVEDPTLESLFREKRIELELELSLVGGRLSPRFLPTSMALYRAPDAELIAEARALIAAIEPEEGTPGRMVSASGVAVAAERELDHYRAIDPHCAPRVEIRDDVSTIMVSAGNLLIGRRVSVPAHRLDAVVQHEVGTHVVTYWNGRAQPLRLLGSGLAHHDELQEGLAVFAEYLVGGLTPSRLRTLAARVLAVDSVVRGAEFLDTYRMLTDDLGLGDHTAFFVAMRVHRGGGFVKDAIYLRGLHGVVRYLQRGGRLDTLLVGKIAPEHSAVIEELQRRDFLSHPALRPRFLDAPDTHYRIERLRDGGALTDLVDPP